MANQNLNKAKAAKNDEFYTQFDDIQKEMNAYTGFNPDVFRGKVVLLPCDDPEYSNFTKFFIKNFHFYGIKKLISTSYAVGSKPIHTPDSPSLFETESPNYNADITESRGKIFVMDGDTNGDGVIDLKDLQWQYLEGDGDFRSAEVRKLRDEADVIITNPPFSLFREFLAWIMEGGKKFSIIGNMNAITYKEVFPLIKDNMIWLGDGFQSGNAYFGVPQEVAEENDYAEGVFDEETGLVKFRNCCWFTNIEHHRRHEPMQLMTMEKNKIFSSHKEVRGRDYLHYDNYDAIEVPFTDAIPSCRLG